jgi:hypothetical protein
LFFWRTYVGAITWGLVFFFYFFFFFFFILGGGGWTVKVEKRTEYKEKK